MSDKEGQTHILIVEDEQSLQKALRLKLESEGMRVSSANDGQEGLEIARADHPDLVLLDLIMPKMDGMTFLANFRSEKWGKNAKVIILSNLMEGDTAQKAAEQGVFDFLIKSEWSLSDVANKIKKVLEL